MGMRYLNGLKTREKYELSVTFSEVPEPAAISAIFGALVLFLAFKRRKR